MMMIMMVVVRVVAVAVAVAATSAASCFCCGHCRCCGGLRQARALWGRRASPPGRGGVSHPHAYSFPWGGEGGGDTGGRHPQATPHWQGGREGVCVWRGFCLAHSPLSLPLLLAVCGEIHDQDQDRLSASGACVVCGTPLAAAAAVCVRVRVGGIVLGGKGLRMEGRRAHGLACVRGEVHWGVCADGGRLLVGKDRGRGERGGTGQR